ncbi:MAG: Fic family protein [Christensenellaceae bacterium]|jgi:Fic family protein|nr:Fic family protein [Christensenellaceae bacterium]
MRIFDYKTNLGKYLTTEIVGMISSIHENKGKQELYTELQGEMLETLVKVAKVQSTVSSNRIEGIYTSDKRITEIMAEKSVPLNRNEEEIAGYKNVLNTIHESYNHIEISSNIILQLHRDLYSYAKTSIGGQYKNADNLIIETQEDGNEIIRFKPLPAYLTDIAMNDICREFNSAISKGEIDSLLLIPMFIVDFLCIHPFNDGNGRISRLLTLLLTYRADYVVGKYIGIERLIEETKEQYYEVLQASSQNWINGTNDYTPFIRYFLSILIKAYREFEERVSHLKYSKISKAERVKKIIENRIGKFTKKDLEEACPDISSVTIERTLNAFQKDGFIIKIGNGRYAAYVKNKQ